MPELMLSRTPRTVLGVLVARVRSVLLGDGLRLFEDLGAVRRDLRPIRVVDTPLATHLKYRVVR
ncbi:hypothetical protein ACFZC6_03965 [Streptomyces ossamyceticus]|uniref:Uncharacterized protein n=1 Tax=Streptomyces ossamyceticus TaxID=249581 RepID=A0ABV2UZH4_9ACTN